MHIHDICCLSIIVYPMLLSISVHAAYAYSYMYLASTYIASMSLLVKHISYTPRIASNTAYVCTRIITLRNYILIIRILCV